jgi:hypothetical protein
VDSTNNVGADDGERTSFLSDLIMTMPLTALDELEKAGHLASNSELKSIPFVVSCFLKFAEGANEYADPEYSTKVHSKAGRLISYLKQHKITLNDDTGVSGTEERVEEFSSPKYAYSKFPKNNRWGITAATKRYLKTYYGPLYRGNIGGDSFDITKMTKSERLKGAYGEEGIDPYTAEAKEWFVHMEDMIRKGNQPSDS